MRCFIISILIVSYSFVFAQPKELGISQLHQYTQKHPQEKLFVHTDRNFLVAGETSWLKIYLVDGQSHVPVNSSRVAYLELLNSENQPVLQTKVELTNGVGKGAFTIPASFNSGNYYLRAYTRWMQNQSPEFYYHQPITIVNTFRRLFDAPAVSHTDLDIQFFPEGGQWIDGIQHKIAFRATDPTGKGIDFSGALINSVGDTLLRFKPYKLGIGNFQLTPQASQTYTAYIRHKGKTTAIQLPKVHPLGYAIQIEPAEASFDITLHAKGVMDQSLLLVAHTRGQVKVATSLALKDGAAKFQLSKSELDSGISHITLFTASGQPVCERLVFVEPPSNPLNLTLSNLTTGTRKKITATVVLPTPAKGNLSVAVIKVDSLQQFELPDIVSYLLLTSDLKGQIENPASYFNAPAVAVDNLMLTHGWSRFRWDDLTQPRVLKYIPEYRGHLLEVALTDKRTQAPAAGVIGYVSAPDKKVSLAGGISDKNGVLLVEARHLRNTNNLFLQSPYPQAKLEIKSPFSKEYLNLKFPPINLSEKNKNELIDKSISMQVGDAFGRPIKYASTGDSTAFYGIAPETYLLDDYTRFPVMEEVMREYVKSVWVRKRGDQFYFRIVDREQGHVLENEPLVLLDGVPVFNINEIMAFDPLRIKQLDILPSRYFVGSLAFDGIVSYRTYKGDLGGFKFNTETNIVSYEGLQAYREFYSPRYETIAEINSRVPDARHVLYWNPELQMNANEPQQVEFYTSDQPGTYRLVVQGLASDGTPLFGNAFFTVKR
ncbi:MAG: hypothetical protein J0L66_09145 [Cytophagales bacterium]|nr:hypothetical protein [Cytophagales bacterium]